MSNAPLATDGKPASLETILAYMDDSLLNMSYREAMAYVAKRLNSDVQRLALDHYFDEALRIVLRSKKSTFLTPGKRVLASDIVNLSKQKGLPLREAVDYCRF